jgi:hypothetical protein
MQNSCSDKQTNKKVNKTFTHFENKNFKMTVHLCTKENKEETFLQFS